MPACFDAEDLVQAAVLEVLRASERFQPLHKEMSPSCALPAIRPVRSGGGEEDRSKREPGHAVDAAVDPAEARWWAFVKPRAYGAMMDLVRRQWPETQPEDASELPSSDNPEAHAIERAQVRILLERIRRLPRKQRAFVRFKIEGRTHSEIARRLGVSLPRVSQIKKMVEEKVA